jgi:integrase
VASVHIVKRPASDGVRYRVRYRLGGREARILYGGSFRTRRDAEERARYIAGELAAQRVPDLRTLEDRLARMTLAVAADRWLGSRVDLAPASREVGRFALRRIGAVLGSRDLRTLTPDDIQELVGVLARELAPGTVRDYLGWLRQVLDHAGVDPNPARDRRVRLPRDVREEHQPPGRADVEALLSALRPRWRLPVRLLEATGLRVGELAALRWGDIDVSRSRLRVSRRRTKSAAGQRWAAVPWDLMEAILDTCPPDDRDGDRLLFPDVTAQGLRDAMARACRAAGIAHIHPHALRHLFASRLVAAGVSIREVAARMGHSRTSMTLDHYAHVVVADD